MPYSTIPITSGAAKFSTLDPDGSLFLQEQDITRGPDPENPIKFYNQQTGELNAVNSIITSEEELNINSSDLTGVKRFICADYLGAIKATASNTEQATLLLGHITGGTQYTKFLRIPSNFVQSTIYIQYSVKAGISALNSTIEKYDPNTQTYTAVFSKGTSANTSELITSSEITVNAGELYCLHKGDALNSSHIYGDATKILCNYEVYPGAVWDVVTP